MTESDPERNDPRPESGNLTVERRPSKTELIVGLVRDRFWSIVAVGFVLMAVGMYIGVDPEIPRFWKIAGAAGIAMTPVGYLTGNKVVEWLYNPSWIWLLDLSAAEEKGGLYRFTESDFRDLEVLDGQLDRLAPGLFVGKRVDPENMKVAGTWRGTLSDRDLLLSLRKVRECRGQLEDDARKGFVLRSSAFTIVRRAVRETTKSVVETFERGTLPDDGDAMTDAIDSELEDFGVSDDLDETIEELAKERMEQQNGSDDEGKSFVFDAEPEPSKNGSEPLETEQ
ncbi:hypothetical protein DJ84_01160 [Halorubrum ezzemoulense]|nr:hypothetical protein DJ84_01160 [Halorubrum ezzemoulense]